MHTKGTKLIFFQKKKNSARRKLSKETIPKMVFHGNEWKYAKKNSPPPQLVPILDFGIRPFILGPHVVLKVGNLAIKHSISPKNRQNQHQNFKSLYRALEWSYGAKNMWNR